MKKIIVLLLYAISLFQLEGQIGIYTEDPKALFHLKTNKNNNSDQLQAADDIVITSDGNIGIGTINPLAKLDIRGQLKYVNGTESNDYILTSDAEGNARWAKDPNPEYIAGIIPSFNPISNQYKLIGPNITLEAGSWMISFVGTYSMQNAPGIISNIFWDLSTSNTNLVSIGQVISNPSEGISSTVYGLATIYAVYLVYPSVKTTYYMWARASNLPNSTTIEYSGEGKIWAIAIGDQSQSEGL